MKRIVIDLDNTLTLGTPSSGDYSEAPPNPEVIARLRQYRDAGFEIAIHTSRNMRTYEGNVGKISANTAPVILEWLAKHDIPYDELWVGKPWCGFEGFYVDDRAIRPSEFVEMEPDEIRKLIGID